MIPNINENSQNRKTVKRERNRLFNAMMFKERFRTIERVFAGEDKYWRLLLRFEWLSEMYYVFKTLSYTLLNLRADQLIA